MALNRLLKEFRSRKTVVLVGLIGLASFGSPRTTHDLPLALTPAGAAPTATTFTQSGVWNVPVGTTTATFEVWGAGGAGGVNSAGEGGGGGGAYARSTVSFGAGVTGSYTITVGPGGVPGVSKGKGASSSAVPDASMPVQTQVVAAGGSAPGGNGRTSGDGGSVRESTGDVTHAGGAGGTSSGANVGGGGGGSSAGPSTVGNPGANTSTASGGAGGLAPAGGYSGGSGGDVLLAGVTPASPNGGGGGGGGGAGANAASGASGLVVITYDVPAAQVSVSLSDGSVNYGLVAPGASADTTAGGLNDTQTATNDGDTTEDFNIRGQSSLDWSLTSAPGPDQYVHSFCKTGTGSPDACDSSPIWTPLAESYQPLATGVAPSGSQRFDLRLTMPTSTASTKPQAVDVIIQAVGR